MTLNWTKLNAGGSIQASTDYHIGYVTVDSAKGQVPPSASTSLTSINLLTYPGEIRFASPNATTSLWYSLIPLGTFDSVTSIASQPWISAQLVGATGNGTTDDTSKLQAAATAAAGGTLLIPAGNYRVSAPIVIPSNTIVQGAGPATRIFTTASTGFSFFVNPNLSVYGTTGNYGIALDSNIVIQDLACDYGSLNDGGTHAIGFRLAQNCLVKNVIFTGGNDAVAILASKNMTVRDCVATGCTNVAYDHWDGCENCLVENCVATMQTATSAGQNTGIMFTASSTSNVGTRVTRGCIARGNKIYNAGVAVFINQLDTVSGSKTVRCIAEDNEAYSCIAGFFVTGTGYGHQVLNNYVEGGGGASAGGALIRIAGESGGIPTDCRTAGNIASGYIGAGANVGLMSIAGSRHILGDLTLVNGSGISGGTVYWIQTASSGCVIEGSQTLDAASISAVSFGLFQGNNASVTDTNCIIRCWDGFAGNWRNQGGTDSFTSAPSFLANTSIPAGGTAGSGLKLSSAANFGLFFGSGVPTLSAAQGSIYLRSDGSSTSTRMYVNTNGSTGWAAVTTAS